MRVPKLLKDADQHGLSVGSYDYHDGGVIAVDFGQTPDELAVDTAGKTAIVVIGDRQFEFELPDEASDVSIKNGILTISE